MAQHDYVIDNQSAPSARSDLNGALQAIVTQNSGASAPTTTYSDMFWYDTANNQIKKRNEANSAWITLGTIDEATGKFTPNSALTTTGIDPATLVVAAEGIASNNNDTTIPTCAAVKAYADSIGSPLLAAPTAGNTLIKRLTANGQGLTLHSTSSSSSVNTTASAVWSPSLGVYTALQAGTIRIQGTASASTTGTLSSPFLRIYRETTLVTSVYNTFTVDVTVAAGESIYFGYTYGYQWGSGGGSASFGVSDIAIYAASRTIWGI